MDSEELWGATGAKSVAGWWPGSSAPPRRTRTPSRRSRTGSRSSRAVSAGLREGRLSLDQVGVIAGRAARGPMSTTRSWRRARRSASCAPRSSWKRPNPNHGSNPIRRPSRCASRADRARAGAGALDQHDHRRGIHHLPDHASARRGGDSSSRVGLSPDALVADWKRDHETGRRRGRPGVRESLRSRANVQTAYSIETFAWDGAGNLLIKTYCPMPEAVGAETIPTPIFSRGSSGSSPRSKRLRARSSAALRRCREGRRRWWRVHPVRRAGRGMWRSRG